MNTSLKSFTVMAITAAIVFIGSISTSSATEIWPGGSCKAANLNQAKQLSWSQWGVENPQPIGGAAYYVLCNIGPKDPTKSDASQSYEIGVQYLDPAATKMSCVFRVIDADSTPNVIVGQKSTADINESFAYDTVVAPSNSSWNHYTVVCALFPQTRLTYITLENY